MKIKSIVKFLSILTASGILLFQATASFATASDEELMNRARTTLGPLPDAMVSADNPITPEKVRLGRMLFWESRISIDGTVSCAKCHPMGLYAADGLKKAAARDGKILPRNSPTILNAADQISQHWIGNRASVEDQAAQSVTGPPTFGMPSNEAVETVLKAMRGYVSLFKSAFPADKEPVTVANLGKAIGAFERTLVTPAPFDDFVNGNAGALTKQQKRGLKTFLDTGCMVCHVGPYLGGKAYQKFGVFEPYEKYTKSLPVDEGRFAVTKKATDKYVFKVPVLRNVANTPPYFHDGSVEKLEVVVTIMARIQLAKDLTPEQVSDIVAFLKSLTGQIPESALMSPVLPSVE